MGSLRNCAIPSVVIQCLTLPLPPNCVTLYPWRRILRAVSPLLRHHWISVNGLYVPQVGDVKPWRGTELAKYVLEFFPSRVNRQLEGVAALIY